MTTARETVSAMLLLGAAFLLTFPLAGETARRPRAAGALPRLWWARARLRIHRGS